MILFCSFLITRSMTSLVRLSLRHAATHVLKHSAVSCLHRATTRLHSIAAAFLAVTFARQPSNPVDNTRLEMRKTMRLITSRLLRSSAAWFRQLYRNLAIVRLASLAITRLHLLTAAF